MYIVDEHVVVYVLNAAAVGLHVASGWLFVVKMSVAHGNLSQTLVWFRKPLQIVLVLSQLYVGGRHVLQRKRQRERERERERVCVCVWLFVCLLVCVCVLLGIGLCGCVGAISGYPTRIQGRNRLARP